MPTIDILDLKIEYVDNVTTEDEFHFLIACDKYRDVRKELFLHCVKYNKLFERYTDVHKFLWLLTNEDMGTLKSLGTYITEANKLHMD